MPICYRDRTFCSAACATVECSRNITDEVLEGARKWAAGWTDDVPIAQMDMSKGCESYQPVTA